MIIIDTFRFIFKDWLNLFHRRHLNFAREEAVNRLQKVPYSIDTIDGHVPPKPCDWVFPKEYEDKFKKKLKVDDDLYRRENNFLLKPYGPIWEKLVDMYQLQQDASKSAYHIHRYCSEFSFLTHYSFATYRPDDNWRNGPVLRHEIQPIIDISRLPDFHYLPYEEAVQLVETMRETEGFLPEFV